MPPLVALLPAIIAGIGAAGTGISLGETLANQPGSPKPPTLAETTPVADKTKQEQIAALSGATPNIQAQTGGSLSPDAWAQLAALLSGQAGTPGISSSQTDLVQKLLTGNTGGGTVAAGNNAPGTPATPGGLTNTTFG